MLSDNLSQIALPNMWLPVRSLNIGYFELSSLTVDGLPCCADFSPILVFWTGVHTQHFCHYRLLSSVLHNFLGTVSLSFWFNESSFSICKNSNGLDRWNFCITPWLMLSSTVFLLYCLLLFLLVMLVFACVYISECKIFSIFFDFIWYIIKYIRRIF